jgi:hypothetical protein
VVEDVDEQEVRKRAVAVGHLLGVDQIVRPRRGFDVGQDDVGNGLSERSKARPELDRGTGDSGKPLSHHAVPLAVQPADERALVPCLPLIAQRSTSFMAKTVAVHRLLLA